MWSFQDCIMTFPHLLPGPGCRRLAPGLLILTEDELLLCRTGRERSSLPSALFTSLPLSHFLIQKPYLQYAICSA